MKSRVLFYLTDFLAWHFERLVVRPLKLDVHPQLRDAYFGNYRRLVFLSQTSDESLFIAAKHLSLGKTPTAILMQRRLERAHSLVLHSHLPLAVVSVAVGFSSQSHLTSSYKK